MSVVIRVGPAPGTCMDKSLKEETKVDSPESDLKRYLIRSPWIDGWFDTRFVEVLSAINIAQIVNKISGHVAEIGVYHGKSFVPLALMCLPGEVALAVDCFEQQSCNTDKSGGNAVQFCKFIQTVHAFGCYNRLRLLPIDSRTATPKDYVNAAAPDNNNKSEIVQSFRLFSIDGSHVVSACLLDLQNAEATLVKGGVIILDDCFNPEWPGVVEALSQFMSKSILRPFFIGYNKVLLTHPEFISNYQTKLINTVKTSPKKRSTFFDCPVLIYT